MLIGYARVSTADQNPDHQIDALLRAGVARDNIHVDKASGAKASRPKLDLVLQLLREGDTLKVTRLDRLSRPRSPDRYFAAGVRDRSPGTPSRCSAASAVTSGLDRSEEHTSELQSRPH